MPSITLSVIASVLSPPVLVVLIVFYLIGGKAYKHRDWTILSAAWLLNLIYLQLDTFSQTVQVFRVPIYQPILVAFSTLSSLLFMEYARRGSRFAASRFLAIWNYLLALVVILWIPGLLKLSTGCWFVAPPPTPSDTSSPVPYLSPSHEVLAMAPAILYSMSALLATSRIQARFFTSHALKGGSWISKALAVYAVLQLAYLAKPFSPNLVLVAFALALASKLSIAVGLVLWFRSASINADRLAIALWQQMAFSTFAHELKHPILELRALAQTVKRYLDDKEYRRATNSAGQLVKTADSMVSIIERVNIAAMPFKSSELEYVEVNNVVDEAIGEVKKYADSMECDVELLRDYGKGLYICVVPVTARQMFTNVIRNAYEACMDAKDRGLIAGVARVRVTTGQCVEDGRSYVILSVLDNGIGITRDQLPRIFEPYETRKTGVNRGLGLWVVRSFVQMYGGKIEATSPPPMKHRGTRMAVYLPLATDAQRKDNEPARFHEAVGGHLPEIADERERRVAEAGEETDDGEGEYPGSGL